jgi:hypothetical protein
MSKIIQWINENKIGVMFMGGAIVISTAYGTCTLEPNTGGQDAEIEIQQEAESSSSDGSAAEQDN